MPQARKKKAPITASASSKTSSSPNSSRRLIRQFHVLLKQQTKLRSLDSGPQSSASLADVERKIEALGGLKAYQRMSQIGQGNDRGGGSEKVLVAWLREMGVLGAACTEKLRWVKPAKAFERSMKPHHGMFRLLEVGALKPDNYKSCATWIDATPMDLHSQHPSIMEQDFLLMDEAENHERWNIISLSLVLNFVPEPKDRGKPIIHPCSCC